MQISHFHVKNLQKATSKREILFLLEISQYGCKNNPKFYADFWSEEIIQKKCTEKS
jgi:hypothetical protein